MRERKNFTVVLYNIRYGTGAGLFHHLPFPFAGALRSSTERFSRIAEMVAGQAPDVACLVESDLGGYRSRGVSQGETLARLIRGSAFERCKYGVSSPFASIPATSLQGNSIVAKTPPSSVSYGYFSRGVKKLFIEAEWKEFRLVLVHLALGRSARAEQVRELASRVGGVRDVPLLVMGDGNFFGGEREMVPLLEAGLKPVETGPTWPSSRPSGKLDFVMVSYEVEAEAKTLPVAWSDHLPVVCSFSV